MLYTRCVCVFVTVCVLKHYECVCESIRKMFQGILLVQEIHTLIGLNAQCVQMFSSLKSESLGSLLVT